MQNTSKLTCPCCGYKTLATDYYGSFIICDVCFWEDDESQMLNPTSIGGANKTSLIDSQKNFIAFGACELEMKQYVREPYPDEVKDQNWKPLF